MKKIFYLLLGLAMIFIIWYCYTNRIIQKAVLEKSNRTIKVPVKNQFEINSNIPVKVPRPEPLIEINKTAYEITNALTEMNLAQWTNAIKTLKPLAGFKFEQHWLAEQPGRTNGIPVVLNLGDKTIRYDTVLISIEAENETGDIMATEMQTPNMSIDETRVLGLQLSNMLNLDPNDFLAWCDKVGNHWLDTPLFGAKYFRDPNTNMIFTFQILRGYSNEKPWLINFIIERPN